jgi:hypothetical protein
VYLPLVHFFAMIIVSVLTMVVFSAGQAPSEVMQTVYYDLAHADIDWMDRLSTVLAYNSRLRIEDVDLSKVLSLAKSDEDLMSVGFFAAELINREHNASRRFYDDFSGICRTLQEDTTPIWNIIADVRNGDHGISPTRLWRTYVKTVFANFHLICPLPQLVDKLRVVAHGVARYIGSTPASPAILPVGTTSPKIWLMEYFDREVCDLFVLVRGTWSVPRFSPGGTTWIEDRYVAFGRALGSALIEGVPIGLKFERGLLAVLLRNLDDEDPFVSWAFRSSIERLGTRRGITTREAVNRLGSILVDADRRFPSVAEGQASDLSLANLGREARIMGSIQAGFLAVVPTNRLGSILSPSELGELFEGCDGMEYTVGHIRQHIIVEDSVRERVDELMEHLSTDASLPARFVLRLTGLKYLPKAGLKLLAWPISVKKAPENMIRQSENTLFISGGLKEVCAFLDL